MSKKTNVGKSNITFSDNIDVVLGHMQSALLDAANEVAGICVDAVQYQILYGYSDLHGNPPHTEIVETGALFDSIKAEVEQVSQNACVVSIGTDIPYAVYVHEGTYKLKARHFITDGISLSSDKIKSAVLGAIKVKIKM